MKAALSQELINCREKIGDHLIDNTCLPIGRFIIKHKKYGDLVIVSSFGLDWDHVSVSVVQKGRRVKLPTWGVMCWVKDMFFDPEETVIQYHPPKSKYINNHPGVLHLWRPHKETIPMPPIECV